MKISQIQGLRAIAILGVFISHTAGYFSDDLGMWINAPGRLGAMGVATFFIISGFLYSQKNIEIKSSTLGVAILNAWCKVRKLYWLHLLTLVVAFVAKYPESFKDWIKLGACLPFQLTLSQSFIPHVGIINSYNGPSWFLSALFGVWVIVFFFPSITNRILTSSANQSTFILCIILIIQICYKGLLDIIPFDALPANKADYFGWFTYFGPIICYSVFCLGVCLGRISKTTDLKLCVQNSIGLFALILFFCFLLVSHVPSALGIVVNEVLPIMAILSIIRSDSLGGAILSNKALVYLGNISGYIFLIHGAVNFAIRHFIEQYFDKPFLFFMSFAITLIFSASIDPLRKYL